MHPTGGSLRVFRLFVWLEVDTGKLALSRPAHQRVTPAVSPLRVAPIIALTILLILFPQFGVTEAVAAHKAMKGGVSVNRMTNGLYAVRIVTYTTKGE